MLTKANEIIGTPLWDRSYAQSVDRITSSTYGIHPLVLMEAAGRAVANFILDTGAKDREVLILAGPGNNGGDALVAARYLADAGIKVHCFLVLKGDDAKFTESCLRQKRSAESLGIDVRRYVPGIFAEYREKPVIIMDGVFGIGFKGKLKKESTPYKALIEASQFTDSLVVAVDVPSGADVDSGMQQDIQLPADVTITFGAKKPIHVLSPGRDYCGEVIDVDIGFPSAAAIDAMEETKPDYVLVDPESVLSVDPWATMPKSSHKYDRGHILVIGGSDGKTGAPLMAAMSALRSGAGWATVAMPESAHATLKGEVPREITFENLFKDDIAIDCRKLIAFIEERKVKSIVVGPGMTHSPFNGELTTALVRFSKQEGFVVVDAGGLEGIGVYLAKTKGQPDKWILTPHPGEWIKLQEEELALPLTKKGLAEAQQIAGRWGTSLVFKNAAPLVISPHEDVSAFVTDEGTTALARAGSGDLLAGVIAAHGAQGFDAATAALRGQIVMARAAKVAAGSNGEHGVLANDILQYLGRGLSG